MRKILLILFFILSIAQYALAQPATYGIPVSLGRNRCNATTCTGGGTDSMYFFNYVAPNLTRATFPNAYRPRLKIGPASTTDRWNIFAATISFNPKDGKLYYLWTDYGHVIRPASPFDWTYIWRFRPDTTFATGAPPTTSFLDTLRSFPYDIGGVAFDNDGTGWTLEFPFTYPNNKALFRPIDFVANIYNTADTLDFTNGPGGIGGTMYNPGSGDITMMPSGQIYFNFDNKLYTPDYGSYGGATKHIKATFIDTTRRPAGASALVGLSFADGDLIASYATGARYRRLDPVTGDTNYISYTYATNQGVYSVDMTQINSGIGSSKRLVSATPTGFANQYDVVYDVYVRNYGTIPITNLQLQDNLGNINGPFNVSNVSAVFTSNPAGLTLNPLFNGVLNTNLLNAGQTLPNFPSSNNNFTIRISCRLSNILQGVVYNNSARVTANGFNNTALRDSSTNGSNPDLNQNDKPDDFGESQPTPLLITITPTTDPCAVLSQVLYNQNFGTGNGLLAAMPGGLTASTGYIGTATAPIPANRTTYPPNALQADPVNFINIEDHTTDVNGRMMVVNADAAARIIYADTLPVVCPNQQYSFSYWSVFLGNSTYQTVCDALGGFRYPLITARIRDVVTGLVIVQLTADTLKQNTWRQSGMRWVMPSGYSNVILELVNAGPGGCGNDFALDDIQFGLCDPTPTVSIGGPSICLGSPVTFSSTLTDGGIIPGAKEYQWQVAPTATGPWTDILLATAINYTINPVNPVDTGKFYRVIVAASGNMLTPSCRYNSAPLKLIGVAPSTAPTSISAPAATLCLGSSTTLTAMGGTLGTGANYQWGNGSVVGTTPIVGATSSTLVVSPGFPSATYWVQILNNASPCTASTGGVTTTINVNRPSSAPSSLTGADFCNPGTTTLSASGGTLGTGASYEWGTGAVVGVSPIATTGTPTFVVSPAATTTYWVRIINTVAPCPATTGGTTRVITVSQPSVAATSATKNKNTICPGVTVDLTAVGGTLGSGATWRWYTGSPGGTLVGTGTTISVTPIINTTYYVRAEGSCNTTADQSVTVVINCDIDKDNDGIPDFVESNIATSFADANGNGVINAYDPTFAAFVDNNGDFINDNFQADGDSDNDGILNYLDPTFTARIDVNADGVDDRFDADLDGIINMLDKDSDNDGIADVAEAFGVDVNGDGAIDNYTDTDGDGLSDNVDTRIVAANGAYNTGVGLNLINLDGDALPNFLDLDSDNDGIPDLVEVLGPDANNNGLVDVFTDANFDGMTDGYNNGTGGAALLITGTDVTADGRADSWPNKNLDRDLRPNAYDMDSDGDGIADVIEAGSVIADANYDGRADGVIGTNGWSTTVSASPTLTLRNTDAAGSFDFLDIDADDDGIPDNIEGMSTLGYQLPTTTDADGDGLMTPYDNVVGFGGAGIFVYDHDGDGTPDYRDLDTDGDGSTDRCEGNDWNLNGICDEVLFLTGLDTDGDGLDNRFDSLNSVTNLKGTSYMMGNGGSLTGDATPGTKATVQKQTIAQLDRDWRFVGSVLPVQFLSFTGTLQNSQVFLNWNIIAAKEISHFEIERSTDNSTYSKTGIVNDAVQLNKQQGFGFTDDISNVSSDIIYYRLKVIGKSGEVKYSNVLVIRRSQTKTAVTVMPNPANDYAAVRFFAEKDSEITLRLLDNNGKTVIFQKQKVKKGNNTIQLNELAKYSSGVYTLQLLINGELTSHKLILSR